MKKLLLILCLFICLKAFGQTPTQPTPVNQMTWYKDLAGHMWAYRGATLGWVQMVDFSQLNGITFLPKANNGLHISADSTIQLGGDMLDFTNINMPINTGLNLVTPDGNALFQFDNAGLDDGLFTVQMAGSTQKGGTIEITPTNTNLNFYDIALNKTSGIHITPTLFQLVDQTRLKGATYATDYSAVGKLDNRWIPDWGAVKSRIDSSGSNYVNLTTNQTGIGGDKTWTGNHTWHITGDPQTFSINESGWNVTSTSTTNFYGANAADGIFAIGTDRSLALFPYDLSFNRNSFTVHLTGPASIATSSKVQTLQDKSGTIALLSDFNGLTKAHVDSVQASTTQNQILLYDKSFYTALTDFVKYGTFTPSLTTDKGILMTGGVSGTDTTNYIRLAGFTNNDDLLNVEVTFIVNDLTGFGIGVGRKTISTTSDYSAFGKYDLVNNNVISQGFVATRTNPSNIVVAVNDVCRLIFRTRGNMLITDFYDVTQNKYATVSGVNNILNTGDIVITEHGGSVTIKGIKAYSSSPRNPNLVFLSDSKLRNPVSGFAIGNWDNSFGITATFAGQGDKVTHLLRGLPYVLKYIKPKQVIVNIGRNDINAGVIPDSVKTQYATLIHKLDSAGINAGYFKAIPETVIPDQSALNHLVDSLTTRTIDVSPYWSNAIDLGADGIHPNVDGARLLAWVTKRTNYFDTTSVYSQPKVLTEDYFAKYNQNNNFNTNQVVNGVVIGTRTTFPSDANSHIYTTGVNAPAGYPFANSNQLVLESSANTNKAIVFRTNQVTRAYIDASGNMTVGKTDGTVAVTGAKLSVSGPFGATGTVTLGTYSSTGGVFATNTAGGALVQIPAVATGNVLISQGLNTVPIFGKVTSAHIDASVAPTASPTFTGTPTLPTGTIAVTQAAGNSTTAVATTAFVTTADNLKANIASPTLTGIPAAPTASAGTNTTQLATTAFVQNALGVFTDNILSKTANYTIVSGDFVAGKKTTLDLYVDATAGNVTITLPSASTFAGYTIYVTKTDLSVNIVTVNTVLGLNTLTTQYQSRQFNSNGTSFYNH